MLLVTLKNQESITEDITILHLYFIGRCVTLMVNLLSSPLMNPYWLCFAILSISCSIRFISFLGMFSIFILLIVHHLISGHA